MEVNHQMLARVSIRSRDGAVVRALASHQCVPGSIIIIIIIMVIVIIISILILTELVVLHHYPG